MILNNRLGICVPWQDELTHGYSPNNVFSLLEKRCLWTDYLCQPQHVADQDYTGMVWKLTPLTAEGDLSHYPSNRPIIAANEPEVATESNTPVNEAVDGLKILQAKFPNTIAPNCNIVFAAGMDYMTQFAVRAKQKNCTPWAWGLHFHGLLDGNELEQHYRQWRENWYTVHGANRWVVISEAAPNHLANLDQKASFLRRARSLVDSDDKLLAFFWFSSRYRAPGLEYYGSFEWAWLLRDDTNLSEIGYVFKNELHNVAGFFPIANKT